MKLWQEPIILASTSPRRKELLATFVDEFTITTPIIDDGVFAIGSMPPKRWVQTLAVLKAQDVQKQCSMQLGTVLAADTVCVLEERLYGQPRTADEARAMILSMMGKEHDVLTGWCLVATDGSALCSGVEKTIVRLGDFSGALFEEHIESEAWQGKAGGYNYLECSNRGWPLDCIGEVQTVIGLPTKRLQQLLSKEKQDS